MRERLLLAQPHERAIFRVLIPAAKSGVIAAVAPGVGGAIGETMAGIMVAGNQARMSAGIFKEVRTLTANIVIEMGYATGVVLLVFILIINFCVAAMNRRNSHE